MATSKGEAQPLTSAVVLDHGVRVVQALHLGVQDRVVGTEALGLSAKVANFDRSVRPRSGVLRVLNGSSEFSCVAQRNRNAGAVCLCRVQTLQGFPPLAACGEDLSEQQTASESMSGSGACEDGRSARTGPCEGQCLVVELEGAFGRISSRRAIWSVAPRPPWPRGTSSNASIDRLDIGHLGKGGGSTSWGGHSGERPDLAKEPGYYS